jgi:hypothetical protein
MIAIFMMMDPQSRRKRLRGAPTTGAAPNKRGGSGPRGMSVHASTRAG